MLAGYLPFQSKTQDEVYKKVQNLTYVWPNESESSNYIPEEAKDLVSRCLNLVDEERPDPDDIVEHPFFNMYEGCIPRQLDPSCRFNKPLWLRDASPKAILWYMGTAWTRMRSSARTCTRWTTPLSDIIPAKRPSTHSAAWDASLTGRLGNPLAEIAQSRPFLSVMWRTPEVCDP